MGKLMMYTPILLGIAIFIYLLIVAPFIFGQIFKSCSVIAKNTTQAISQTTNMTMNEIKK
jgi:hypothetical protein